MDFSCDRCGRRFFVPDDLVHGRVFRAKCEDCDHAFDVVAPDPGAAASPAGLSPTVRIAITDADVAALVDGAGAPAPSPPPAASPVEPPAAESHEAGSHDAKEDAPEEELPDLPEVTEPGLPLKESAPPAPAAVSPIGRARIAHVPAREATAGAATGTDTGVDPPVRPERSGDAQASARSRRAATATATPTSTATSTATATATATSTSTATATARATPAPTSRPTTAPARRPAPREADDVGGTTGEYELAAGTRHRHRNGILVAGVAVAAVAAGALLLRGARPGPERAQRASPSGAASAPLDPAAAPLDPSSLAARAPADRGAPAALAAAGKRRRLIGVPDRKLLDLLARKDDVAMAAPAGDVELDSAKDVLDPAAVERTVAASRRAFDACVTKALRMNPGLRVGKRATLIVTVQPAGRVTGAWIAEEQIEGTELGRCLVAASSRMSFPTFEGEPIDVAIPLSLSSIQ